MIRPIEVTPGVFRGSEPKTEGDWADLQDLGINYCLDLETGVKAMSDGDPKAEQQRSLSYGIETYRLPLGEVCPPTTHELSVAVGIIKTLSSIHPIYVHCRAGVDRTGMVMAKWRMRNGWTKRAAVAEMKAMGMHVWYYFWAWFL